MSLSKKGSSSSNYSRFSVEEILETDLVNKTCPNNRLQPLRLVVKEGDEGVAGLSDFGRDPTPQLAISLDSVVEVSSTDFHEKWRNLNSSDESIVKTVCRSTPPALSELRQRIAQAIQKAKTLTGIKAHSIENMDLKELLKPPPRFFKRSHETIPCLHKKRSPARAFKKTNPLPNLSQIKTSVHLDHKSPQHPVPKPPPSKPPSARRRKLRKSASLAQQKVAKKESGIIVQRKSSIPRKRESMDSVMRRSRSKILAPISADDLQPTCSKVVLTQKKSGVKNGHVKVNHQESVD